MQKILLLTKDPSLTKELSSVLPKGAKLTSARTQKASSFLVEEMGGSFRTRAKICNVYVGADRIPRLNLHFLDTEAPDRLMAGT